MNLVFGVLIAVFGIVSFGLVDSVYAEHPDNIDSELTYDVRFNNCTSFTIFGNVDEIVPIRYEIHFSEYLNVNRNYQYYSYYNYKFPNSDGSFEHTITVNGTYNFTEYGFNEYDDWISPKGTWYLRETRDESLPTELYQGSIWIKLNQYTYKPHRSDWIGYGISTYIDHVHHDNATEHTHSDHTGTWDNPGTTTHTINVRTNPDTNQLCLYKTELVCDDDHNHNDHCELIQIEQSSPIQKPTIPKTTLQIANEQIDELETKKEKKVELKNKWKEKFNTCKDDRKELKTELSDLQSRYNTLESQHNTQNTTEFESTIERLNQELSDLQSRYNTLESQHNNSTQYIQTLQESYNNLFTVSTELQFTIEKLTTELNEAKKKIEELES